MEKQFLETTNKDQWILSREEEIFVNRYRKPNNLQCAVLLKFFQAEGRFPKSFAEIEERKLSQLYYSFGVDSLKKSSYDAQNGTSIRQRTDIRTFLGFRPLKVQDYTRVQFWLWSHVIQSPGDSRELYKYIKEWFWKQRIELPSSGQVERIIKASLASFEDQLCYRTSSILSNENKQALDQLFIVKDEGQTFFSLLKEDPGKPNLDNIFIEISKLVGIKHLKLPASLFQNVCEKTLKLYRDRTATESAWDMRRHPHYIRYTQAAAFCYKRQQEIVDGLIELLIQIVHTIGIRAEKRVIKELIMNIREVSNKKSVLFKIAEAAVDKPDGIVREVLFPAVGENTLKDLVKEYYCHSPIYTEKIEDYTRNSYKRHYRQMVPKIMDNLVFQSNNLYHQPVINALTYLKAIQFTQKKLDLEYVPIDGIIPKSLRPFLIQENAKGNQQIDRISYEICVLRALRNGLRCREIWVEGADRYRNPDQDLPQDFEDKRKFYYQGLSLPLEGKEFINAIQEKMKTSLSSLNKNLVSNRKVSLRSRGKNLIKISPLEPQAEPKFLRYLKAEVATRWPMTSLLDIVKEADVQIRFTDEFKGLGDRQILEHHILQQRLLLCLYALGTNTGIKRVLAGDNNITYDELRYVKERYIHKDSLRAAINKIVNATLRVRQSQIWGEGTTSCASDSKRLRAWDQNLMTEWHVRYKGRGVMIYWHVEKNSLCIYSQLKKCSSSEVSSMIEGVMRHCTDMQIDKQYVDSHGQSEVAFAFCHLLGFSLMPRLKAIARQKLYIESVGEHKFYPNLAPILTRSINWELIHQQYDQMVKYAVALQQGTAHADSILKRFTRHNLQHPTYRALSELGRAIKTVFLCQYLESEALRQEIHDALNVVENCNSTVEFIFFARNSELATNQLTSQEISILALHLLQVCLVYVNTLMIQHVLAEKNWMDKMQEEDLRALTPLIYNHITPYGVFTLDMDKQLFPRSR